MKLAIKDLRMHVEPTNACNDDINIYISLKGTGYIHDYNYLAGLDHNKEDVVILSVQKYDSLYDGIVSLQKRVDNLNHCKPEPIKIICSAPAVIVFWNDGTKTVCKAQNNDEFDLEKGFFACCAKKMFGNEGNYYNKFAKTPVTFTVDKKEKKSEITLTPVIFSDHEDIELWLNAYVEQNKEYPSPSLWKTATDYYTKKQEVEKDADSTL